MPLYHPFLSLTWLWQNRLTNQNPGINHTVEPLLYLGDTCKVVLEGSRWVSWRGTRILCPLDLSLDSCESQIEKVCVWLSQCYWTFIFIWNVLSLHVPYFWLVELVSSEDFSWLPIEYSVKIDKTHLCTREGRFLFPMLMPEALARPTSNSLGDALFDTSEFQETVFVEKKIPCEVRSHSEDFFLINRSLFLK